MASERAFFERAYVHVRVGARNDDVHARNIELGPSTLSKGDGLRSALYWGYVG